MREVYVAGIGITTFTRLEYPLVEIASYASMMALKDAGITEVDQIYDPSGTAAMVAAGLIAAERDRPQLGLPLRFLGTP